MASVTCDNMFRKKEMGFCASSLERPCVKSERILENGVYWGKISLRDSTASTPIFLNLTNLTLEMDSGITSSPRHPFGSISVGGRVESAVWSPRGRENESSSSNRCLLMFTEYLIGVYGMRCVFSGMKPPPECQTPRFIHLIGVYGISNVY